jgi:hypothetical protein
VLLGRQLLLQLVVVMSAVRHCQAARLLLLLLGR